MDEMAYVEQIPSKYKNILEYKNPFTKCMNKCYKWGRNEKKISGLSYQKLWQILKYVLV